MSTAFSGSDIVISLRTTLECQMSQALTKTMNTALKRMEQHQCKGNWKNDWCVPKDGSNAGPRNDKKRRDHP